jgi:branched-chain amino acid transport system ATP-binding protein
MAPRQNHVTRACFREDRSSLCESLRTLNRDGLTMLVVEQDVTTAFDLATRAFVMDSSRTVRSGRSTDLRNDPAVQQAYLGVI